MYITEIKTINYRNLQNISLHPCENLNVFCGKNAQGKTNLLESIYVCAIGKSPRVPKIKDCINWEKDYSIIKIKIQKKFSTSTIDFRILENGKKIILINDVPIKSLSQLLGELNIIHFFPDDLKLIKESPIDRRKFMNIDISQASKLYFENLIKYNNVLIQRNKLLKISKSIDELKNTIGIWDAQLSDYASKIILSRIRFLNKLAPLAKEMHYKLTNKNENLEISYQGEIGNTVEEIKKSLEEQYANNLEKDYSLGYTSTGPHKDDIKIILNGTDLRTFGSQGQQRTASLALKFAEIELFKQQFGENPIILLDDVLSELDAIRRQNLIDVTNNLQCFLTCTEFTETLKNVKIFNIDNGNIAENK